MCGKRGGGAGGGPPPQLRLDVRLLFAGMIGQFRDQD